MIGVQQVAVANNQGTSNGGTTSYTYDNEGDLLQTTVTGSGTTTNTWSADHHLTQVTHSDNTTTTYSYDPFGRLVAENDRGTVTRWVWDGANQRLQYDGNNALTASYVTGRGPSSLLEMTRGGQTSYYLRDGANNVTALTDPSGVLAATYNYDSFGNVLSTTGSVANPFTFAGALSDPGTGGYQMRARSYDPTSGRFLSEDPIGHVNAYSYVKNDPTDYVDPSGLDAVEYSMQVSGDTGVELEAAQAAAEEETAEISELENALSDVTSDSPAPGDAAENCAVNSFTGDTPVLMADGTTKPISQVKPDDVVEAGDAQTGTEKAEPVAKVIVGHGLKHLVAVGVAGETIEATYNHPFWVVEDQRFEWADHLRAGEHVWLDGGRTASIESLRAFDQVTTVYNLSIANVHTFFVGMAPVLVHNSCAEIMSESAARRAAFRSYNVPTSEANNFERIEQWGQNMNMRGPNGEPWQVLRTTGVNGEPVEIQNHMWGHVFDDTGETMGPHYIGADGEHSFYG